jgi:hypothetical protein
LVAAALDTAWESSQEGAGVILPPAHALLYPGGIFIARIPLHGANYIEECFKTVHQLPNARTKIDRVSNVRRSAFDMAVD